MSMVLAPRAIHPRCAIRPRSEYAGSGSKSCRCRQRVLIDGRWVSPCNGNNLAIAKRSVTLTGMPRDSIVKMPPSATMQRMRGNHARPTHSRRDWPRTPAAPVPAVDSAFSTLTRKNSCSPRSRSALRLARRAARPRQAVRRRACRLRWCTRARGPCLAALRPPKLSARSSRCQGALGCPHRPRHLTRLGGRRARRAFGPPRRLNGASRSTSSCSTKEVATSAGKRGSSAPTSRSRLRAPAQPVGRHSRTALSSQCSMGATWQAGHRRARGPGHGGHRRGRRAATAVFGRGPSRQFAAVAVGRRHAGLASSVSTAQCARCACPRLPSSIFSCDAALLPGQRRGSHAANMPRCHVAGSRVHGVGWGRRRHRTRGSIGRRTRQHDAGRRRVSDVCAVRIDRRMRRGRPWSARRACANRRCLRRCV